MRTRVTLRLLDEMKRFDLRWTCDDCAFLIEPEGAARCAHGWPGLSRRDALPLGPDDAVTFCKEFEAG